MTKKQLINWLIDHGVDARGRSNSNGYVIERVGDESFSVRNQNSAHIAAIEKYLEIVGYGK